MNIEILTLLVLQAANFTPMVGSLVWLEDPEVTWIDGEVVEVNGDQIKVLCTSGKTVSAFSDNELTTSVYQSELNRFCQILNK